MALVEEKDIRCSCTYKELDPQYRPSFCFDCGSTEFVPGRVCKCASHRCNHQRAFLCKNCGSPHVPPTHPDNCIHAKLARDLVKQSGPLNRAEVIMRHLAK